MRVAIGTIIAFGLTISAIGGSLSAFIDVPSILVTIGGGFAITLIACPLPSLVQAFKATDDPRIIKRNVLACEAMSRGLTVGAFLGMIMGLIKMLQNLSDPYSVGPSMALTLLSLFTACVVLFYVIEPLGTRWRLASPEASDEAGPLPMLWLGLVAVGNLVVVTAFFVLLHAMA